MLGVLIILDNVLRYFETKEFIRRVTRVVAPFCTINVIHEDKVASFITFISSRVKVKGNCNVLNFHFEVSLIGRVTQTVSDYKKLFVYCSPRQGLF